MCFFFVRQPRKFVTIKNVHIIVESNLNNWKVKSNCYVKKYKCLIVLLQEYFQCFFYKNFILKIKIKVFQIFNKTTKKKTSYWKNAKNMWKIFPLPHPQFSWKKNRQIYFSEHTHTQSFTATYVCFFIYAHMNFSLFDPSIKAFAADNGTCRSHCDYALGERFEWYESPRVICKQASLLLLSH